MQTSGCSHTRRPAVPPKFHHTYVRAKNKLRPPILSIHIYSECELDYEGTKFLSTCVWRSTLWSSNLKVFKLIITTKKITYCHPFYPNWTLFCSNCYFRLPPSKIQELFTASPKEFHVFATNQKHHAIKTHSQLFKLPYMESQ